MVHIQGFIMEIHQPLGEQDTKKARKLIRGSWRTSSASTELGGMVQEGGSEYRQV
jgi:hypothetical protein